MMGGNDHDAYILYIFIRQNPLNYTCSSYMYILIHFFYFLNLLAFAHYLIQ